MTVPVNYCSHLCGELELSLRKHLVSAQNSQIVNLFAILGFSICGPLLQLAAVVEGVGHCVLFALASPLIFTKILSKNPLLDRVAFFPKLTRNIAVRLFFMAIQNLVRFYLECSRCCEENPYFNLKNYYIALGTYPGAPRKEIETACRARLFLFHPDKVPAEKERLRAFNSVLWISSADFPEKSNKELAILFFPIIKRAKEVLLDHKPVELDEEKKFDKQLFHYLSFDHADFAPPENTPPISKLDDVD